MSDQARQDISPETVRRQMDELSPEDQREALAVLCRSAPDAVAAVFAVIARSRAGRQGTR
jgi:hypothetical protein